MLLIHSYVARAECAAEPEEVTLLLGGMSRVDRWSSPTRYP